MGDIEAMAKMMWPFYDSLSKESQELMVDALRDVLNKTGFIVDSETKEDWYCELHNVLLPQRYHYYVTTIETDIRGNESHKTGLCHRAYRVTIKNSRVEEYRDDV